MKHNFIQLLLLFALSFWASAVSAHALWMETSPVAIKNKNHHVKIFYGEYANNEIEPVDKWYSDVSDFKVVLTTPAQKQIELTSTASQDYFEASFTPQEDGIYVLSIVHPAKDLGGKTKYEFSSVALVTVGKSTVQLLNLPFYILIQPAIHTSGQTIEAFVLNNGKPVPEAELLVMSEEGWSKTFKADSKGRIQFPLNWKGKYVLETSVFEKVDGLWHDKSYTDYWQGTTTSIFAQ